MHSKRNVSRKGQPLSHAPLVRIGDIGELFKGKGIRRSDLSNDGFPCLRYGEIYSTYDNAIAYLKSQVSSKAASSAKSLKTGDIVFAASGETLDEIGKAVAYIGPEPAYVGGDTVVLREHHQDPIFLAHALNSEHARKQKARLGKGHSIVHIHAPDLSSVEIYLPPLAEQRRISKLLRTWDDALEKLNALRAAKDRRLDTLRVSLLFGKLRLDRGYHKWAPKFLSAVTHELTDRNNGEGLGPDSVMGISKVRGVAPMRKQMIPSDISRYKRLPPRAFAYIPWSIDIGSFAMNKHDDEVLISPDYITFACNAEGLDPDYLDHLCMTTWWAHYSSNRGSGSVRKRTYYRNLATLKLPLPELDEQRAISEVLNSARYDLATTEREIKAVALQKHGLMQRLLTGEWGVNPVEVSA